VSARAILTRAEAAGLRLRLRPDGRVRVEADAPPPAGLLEELRRYRNEVAALLAEREGRPAREATPTAALGAVEVEAAPALDPAEVEALASALAEAAQTVAEVLRSAPPAEDAEAMVEYYASEPTDRPYVPGDPDPLRDGLLRSALMRPPSWEGGAPPRWACHPPPPGCETQEVRT
jgi:hypothetical protein